MLIILIFLICFLPVNIVEGSPYSCITGWKNEYKETLDRLGITYHDGEPIVLTVGYAFEGVEDEIDKAWIAKAAKRCVCSCVNVPFIKHKLEGICSTLG